MSCWRPPLPASPSLGLSTLLPGCPPPCHSHGSLPPTGAPSCPPPPALTADVKAGQPSENARWAISLSSLHASSNSYWVLSQRNSSPPSPQALNELAPSILRAHCSPSHHTGLPQFLKGPVLPQGLCTGCFLSLPCPSAS